MEEELIERLAKAIIEEQKESDEKEQETEIEETPEIHIGFAPIQRKTRKTKNLEEELRKKQEKQITEREEEQTTQREQGELEETFADALQSPIKTNEEEFSYTKQEEEKTGELYQSGQQEGSVYEIQTVTLENPSKRNNNFYETGPTINPRERAWVDNRRWNEQLTEAGKRSVTGEQLRHRRDMIEGETLAPEAIQDGATTINQKKDYGSKG